MGLFDTVRCEYPLPEPAHQRLEFQTKDLDCLLDEYLITRDGRLVRRAGRAEKGLARDMEWPYHGDVRIYRTNPKNDREFIEYVVRFTFAQQQAGSRAPRSVRGSRRQVGGSTLPGHS